MDGSGSQGERIQIWLGSSGRFFSAPSAPTGLTPFQVADPMLPFEPACVPEPGDPLTPLAYGLVP
jgi:hypothetical protein